MRLSIIAAMALAAACATPGSKTPEPAAAPAIVSLEEMLKRAGEAKTGGQRAAARALYKEAATAYPAGKEAWLKLAEDYFEASDYGNAIQSALEVTARDREDRVANSVIAVSSLRLSAAALKALRDQQNGLTTSLRDQQTGSATSTRDEAVAITRALRETLGESVLVPRTVVVEESRPAAASPVRRPTAAPRPTTAATPSTPSAPVATPPAKPVKTTPSKNPFDGLK